MQSMVITGCVATLTEQRIATFKPYLCGWSPKEPDCKAAGAFKKA
jgi:hypothetical protein